MSYQPLDGDSILDESRNSSTTFDGDNAPLHHISHDAEEVPDFPLLDVAAAEHPPPAAMLIDGPPIALSFYGGGKMVNPDVLISGPKRSPIFYVLASAGKWNMTLYPGVDKKSPPLMKIGKVHWLYDFKITMSSGWSTTLGRPAGTTISPNRDFTGFDGVTMYTWKNLKLLQMACYTQEGEIVATWRRSVALKKFGEFLLRPKFRAEAELIMATALALEAWGRKS